MALAEKSAKRACEWVLQHPESYQQLVGMIDDMRLAHYPRVMRGDIYLQALQHGITITDAQEFRRDHNLWAGIVRIIKFQYPELRNVLHTRKSKLDVINIERMFTEMSEQRETA